jgi:hypothetical protein
MRLAKIEDMKVQINSNSVQKSDEGDFEDF